MLHFDSSFLTTQRFDRIWILLHIVWLYIGQIWTKGTYVQQYLG
jgi:hypothetical protein